MRLTAFLLSIAFMQVSASGLSQRVTLSVKKAPLVQVFNEIMSQTGYLFLYEEQSLSGAGSVDISVKNAPLADVLRQCFANQPLTYTISNRIIVIKNKPSAVIKADSSLFAPPASVTGKVLNDSREPVAGATVSVKGSSNSTATDGNGNFILTGVETEAVLKISSIGYEEISVELNGRTNVIITMTRKLAALDETVFIGYGSSTKRKITGSVSTVKADDIKNLPVSSFDQMLQGLASGLLVNNISGAPGKQTSITIRGTNSINYGAPLFIIDGTPIVSGALGSLFGIDNSLNPFTGINPSDIASIDILKDASASAIYGSRAANGVVLITTKRGREGQTNFTVNAFQGVGVPTGRLNLLNTRDYIMMRREAFRNDNPASAYPNELKNIDSITDTDWQDIVYKPTTIGEYKISMSGGSKATQFFTSASYRKETNPLSGRKGMERGTFRINLDHKASNRFTISASLGLSRDVNQNTADASSSYSAVDAAILAAPNLAPYDANGEFTLVPLPFGVGNPLAVFKTKIKSSTTQVKTNLHLKYDIWNGLSFHTDLGYDYNALVGKIYIPKAVNSVLQNTLFDASLFNNQTNTYIVEPQLRYSKSWGQHQIEAVTGSTFQNTTTVTSNLYGKGFPSDDLEELSAAATTDGSSGRNVYAFTSVFARANYNYQAKYIASATFRRDGSSRFGPGNRFGNFWSVGAGWLFSREKFAENLGFLSQGKIRAGYGEVGSDAIGNYTYIDQWQPLAYGGFPGVRPFVAENPFVHWERTAKMDLGLDLAFLHDRVNLTVNYFRNTTGNMLVSNSLPTQTGYSSVQDNLPAKVQNRGAEFELSTLNLKGKFRWSTKLNLTFEKNVLTSFPGLENTSFYKLNYKVGETLNLLWGYKFLGVDPATGAPLYDGYNTDGSKKNPADPNNGRQIIGKYSPDYYGGITNNFAWNGFSLDIFLQFVKGVDRKNIHTGLNNSASTVSNQEAAVLQRWQKAGDITNTPRAATTATAWWISSGVDGQSDRFQSDASYLRIKNVTLAYSLPLRITQTLRMKEIRFYATAQNLATFTSFKGIDPETGGNVAPVRMIVGGVNIGF